MDICVVRAFANALLHACQDHETGKISTDRLTEPEFLTALHDYLGDALDSWTYLPPPLQAAVQDALYKNGWRLSDDVFDGNIEKWIRHEIDSPLRPQEDAATRLYVKLTRLPNSATPLNRAMRQIYLVEYYHLRRTFQEYFTSPNREPLTTYISLRLGLEAEKVRSLCKDSAYAGERLDAIANELGGFGALLLPHHIARTTLEKRVSINGPDFKNLVQSLAEQGVLCNENTQKYYDLAGEFFSRRRDEGVCLAESLCRNAKSNKWSSARQPRKRIPINPLVKPNEHTAHGEMQLAESDLNLAQNATDHGIFQASVSQTMSGLDICSHQDVTDDQVSSPSAGNIHLRSNTTIGHVMAGDDEISDVDDVVKRGDGDE